MVLPHQKEMIELAESYGALKYGTFKLKSGRESPYFFNAGVFSDGGALARLGKVYATAIVNSGLEYDVIFGPAYKGITLGAVTATALYEMGINKPFTFNRKEAKDHGEGGNLVGAPLAGKKVLVVDDVITAGTAIRESKAIIEAAGGQICGVVVALDRQERGKETKASAIQEVRKEFGVDVHAVFTFSTVIAYLEGVNKNGEKTETINAMKAYKEQFGAEGL
ncbi:Orotate phosphoribosyltransferase [Diplonema papillatum]|uniref:orotate phosphoribosyltransferase n=1 Tax=Diplonema papillatum TaxID=91374 RepID=A0A0B6VT94_9EUGL|nr:Orotate phosphoribosyltransferase [Diplonema papillatum]BAQ25456.1 orotate phosphoribosyltransferase [Diplonema papillatum]|eukprot:gene6317-9679_t